MGFLVFGGVHEREFLNTLMRSITFVSSPAVVVTILNVEPGM